MSIKKNIQALREWAYSNNTFKNHHTATTVIDPNLNSKERNRLKWQSKKDKIN